MIASYLAYGVIHFDKPPDSFDSKEAVVDLRHLGIRIEDVWRHNGSQIVWVHLASRFFVNMGERCCPLEKAEDHF